jgi:hypothetical protein
MNSIAARVQAFEEIRDIPYRFDFRDRTKDTTCLSKAQRLKERLSEFGISSRHMCCRQRWSDAVLMPADLIARAPWPETHHHYLEAMVPETNLWTPLDPTWDIGLEGAGFPVAKWDGINPTVLGVIPVGTFSPTMSEQIVRRKLDYLREQDWMSLQKEFGPFYDGLNRWIASQRTPMTGMKSLGPNGRHYA